MINELIIRRCGESAIEQFSNLLRVMGIALTISEMNKDDLAWCEYLSRQSQYPLEWGHVQSMLECSDTYNFCFQLPMHLGRPEGACACRYNMKTKTLNLEMLQSFAQENSPFAKKAVTFSLMAIIFFLREVGAEGVYIIDPYNDKVASYYKKEFCFRDICGNNAILYLSTLELIAWMKIKLNNNIVQF